MKFFSYFQWVSYVLVFLFAQTGYCAGLVNHKMIFDEVPREYYLYAPQTYQAEQAVPLVLVFHGGGGHAKQIAKFSDFNRIAEEQGFIVVYPESIDKHWNDGRITAEFEQHDAQVNDVGWIEALLEELSEHYAIDLDRVYAVGMSNGGIFTQRLAIDLSDSFAAVASIAAQIAEPIVGHKPSSPISVLMMNGTADPFVPYEGGEVTPYLFPKLARFLKRPKRGSVVSTADTIDYWLYHNDIRTKGVQIDVPDTSESDGVMAERVQWTNINNGVSVVLYKLIEGGHAWPGTKPYMPEALIGRTCQDFNASDAIWNFFARNSKANNVPVMFAEKY